MTRVAHLIAPVSFGGGESLLISLLKERRAQYSEGVITIYRSSKFNEVLDEAGIPRWELSRKTLGHGVSKLKIGLGTVGLLLKLPLLLSILQKQDINIVHAHGYPASVLYGLISYIWAGRGVYTHHSYRNKPGFIEQRILGHFYRRFNCCTAVSRLSAESMQRAFPEKNLKFITVHNCVSSAFFRKGYQKEKNNRKTRFIQVGRFVELKNQALVVQSLAQLNNIDSEKIEVVFAGDGSELSRVKKMAGDLGVSGSVKFLGAVDHDKLPDILGKSDYGIFPSDNEGFGIGAVECLAAGLPVLCLNNNLMKEIVGDAGILVEKSELAQGLVKMMVVGDSLRERATVMAEKYLPEKIKDKYCRIYKELK